MKRVILKVCGDVQGVSFRWRTKSTADALGLTGWVRNEPDGTVKVVAEGGEEELKSLIDKCYTVASANVEDIDIKWQEASGEFEEFEIHY